MFKKLLCGMLLLCSFICFANDRPSNEILREFEKVPFFEFKKHYIGEIVVSYVMIEGHIYVFIRDNNRKTGGLVHSVRCPLCKTND